MSQISFYILYEKDPNDALTMLKSNGCYPNLDSAKIHNKINAESFCVKKVGYENFAFNQDNQTNEFKKKINGFRLDWSNNDIQITVYEQSISYFSTFVKAVKIFGILHVSNEHNIKQAFRSDGFVETLGNIPQFVMEKPREIQSFDEIDLSSPDVSPKKSLPIPIQSGMKNRNQSFSFKQEPYSKEEIKTKYMASQSLPEENINLSSSNISIDSDFTDDELIQKIPSLSSTPKDMNIEKFNSEMQKLSGSNKDDYIKAVKKLSGFDRNSEILNHAKFKSLNRNRESQSDDE